MPEKAQYEKLLKEYPEYISEDQVIDENRRRRVLEQGARLVNGRLQHDGIVERDVSRFVRHLL